MIFGSLVMRFANDFHSWLHDSWKLLANRLTRDPKIVIHGNSCIILYIYNDVQSKMILTEICICWSFLFFMFAHIIKSTQHHMGQCLLMNTDHIFYHWNIIKWSYNAVKSANTIFHYETRWPCEHWSYILSLVIVTIIKWCHNSVQSANTISIYLIITATILMARTCPSESLHL